MFLRAIYFIHEQRQSECSCLQNSALLECPCSSTVLYCAAPQVESHGRAKKRRRKEGQREREERKKVTRQIDDGKERRREGITSTDMYASTVSHRAYLDCDSPYVTYFGHFDQILKTVLRPLNTKIPT